MFSKEEAKKIRQEFWTWFGRTYPRKWLLYDTKIKDVTLKFTFTNNHAQVSIDIEPKDEIIRAYYFDKLCSLKNILLNEYVSNAIYDAHYTLDNNKVISRIYLSLNEVSIYKHSSWNQASLFLNENMILVEQFFVEYKEVIDS